jgi:quinone-modifying oxidoreductase, subunit QmoA
MAITVANPLIETVQASPSVHRSILVVGGGIAGITAAVEAAEAGYDIYLVEKESYLGGRVAQLNKYFPKLCPPYCGLEINFQRLRKNKIIHIFTLAEVESISGQPGNFDVTVRQNPRFVNERCTACNACVPVCPTTRPDSFNMGMGTTKSIYLPHALAFPMKYVIDPQTCTMDGCAKCVEACEYDAIDLKMQPKSFHLNVGAVIYATGWKPYDAARIDNLGFGRYADVITNIMMERLAAPNGPTQGRIVRPSDGKPVKTVAFVQCAGQRDSNHLGFCSAICCMASLKQATYVRDQYPDSKAYIFYIDLRTPGTYEFFSKKVQSDPNVIVTKGKIARIAADSGSGELIVEAEDILAMQKRQYAVDLVVLATGMAPAMDEKPSSVPLSMDKDHFIVPEEMAPGIYAAGCARGPADVATSVQDATAAAMKAMQAIHAAVRA